MAREPIFAAGGIVMRGGAQPLIAVVQLRKDNAWMLPKGKLDKGEHVIDAARREASEETGHDVTVHEFLGTMSYETGKKPKIVQFWRMEASEQPVRHLMRDVKAVEWLPLPQAVAKLTHPREQAFLASVGPVALKAAGQAAQAGPADRPAPIQPVDFASRRPRQTLLEKIWMWLRGQA